MENISRSFREPANITVYALARALRRWQVDCIDREGFDLLRHPDRASQVGVGTVEGVLDLLSEVEQYLISKGALPDVDSDTQ